MTDFEFMYAPMLFHQLPSESYIKLAESRRASYGIVAFDRILIDYFKMVDCESMFFNYLNTDFELRCHGGLRPVKFVNIPGLRDGDLTMSSKDYFLLPFGSIDGIKFKNLDISESVLEEACKLLIVNNLHGN